jgi:hypothetical protein
LTRKLRIISAFLLLAGWLFLAPAHAETLSEYNAKVTSAQKAVSDAQAAVDAAQYKYDNNLIQQILSSGSGLTAKVYNNTRSMSPNESNLCLTTTVSQINHNWGGGSVLGCNPDSVTIHYYGTITVPDTGTYRFRNMADDGFYATINGQVVVNEWVDKGCSGNWGPEVQLTANTVYPINAWFYENGGGACSTMFVTQPSGNWQVIPAGWFGQSQVITMVKDPALLLILNQKKADLLAAQQALSSIPAYVYPAINAPTSLNVSVVDTNVVLSWTAPKEGTMPERYAISWSTSSSNGWGIATGNVGDSNALNTSITIPISVVNTDGLDKAYLFSVRSDNDTLRMYSPVSNIVSLYINDPVRVAAEAAALAEKERLAAEAAATAEAARLAAIAAEQARIAAEQLAAAQAAAKAEAERLAAEKARIEAEAAAKLAAELAAKAEIERLAAIEAARIQAEKDRLAAEAAALAEQQRLAAEAAARKAEEDRIAAELAAAKAEADRLAAEEAARKAEEERIAAELAKAKAEEEARLAEEARLKAEAEAKAAEEARLKAEEEARLAEEAKLKAEEEAKIQAEKEAKAKADKLKAEEEANAKAEAEKIAKEKAEQERLDKIAEEAKAGKELSKEQVAVVVASLVENLKPGESISSADIKDSGVSYSDLPASTPIEIRTDENGNALVITAEVAANVELVQDPGALLETAFSDPGAALQALGSIGADMTEEEREEATEMVVATVVAAGAAINAAAVATGGSTGGGTGGGGSSGGGSGANSPGSRGGRKW